jgi:SpoIID/LytB domain protein
MPRASVRRTPPSFARALRVLAGLAAGVTLVGVAAAPPAAAADEVVERSADGVFLVDGHGWGHGRGMSQWGAQGAASLGRTADEIVTAYYPGTARSVLAPAPIRVLLQGDDGADLQVHPASGLEVTDLASGATAELPVGPTMWRVTVDAVGLHVESFKDAVWTPFPLGTATAFVGPVRFSGPAVHRVGFPNGTSRDYRGVVQAVRTGPRTLASVVVLDLEDYLLGVVPRESSASWAAAALQAQSIAARSYSANKRARVAGSGQWDICDTTQCQVFGGTRLYTATAVTELERASTTAAVGATAGVVRTYRGQSILAEYSSSNGGWSTAGTVPYLAARQDPWEGVVPNSVHSWKATLRATDLERRFPTLGTLKRIRVTARDGNGEWGGRVRAVVLEGVSSTGSPTSVTTTGAGVYNARPWPASSDGLRSSWWRLTPSVAPAPLAALRVRPLFKGIGPLHVGIR